MSRMSWQTQIPKNNLKLDSYLTEFYKDCPGSEKTVDKLHFPIDQPHFDFNMFTGLQEVLLQKKSMSLIEAIIKHHLALRDEDRKTTNYM